MGLNFPIDFRDLFLAKSFATFSKKCLRFPNWDK